MPSAKPFQHQVYRPERPTSPYHLLPQVSPLDPAKAEAGELLAQAGASFFKSQVAAIYCIHGTFTGNDLLGLFTELSRFTPGLSESLRRVSKSLVNVIARETGNYTPRFVAHLQAGLDAGTETPIPVRLYHWSSQNNHIARADGAIRLLVELAQRSQELDPTKPQRILLWGHSHGGNVLALISQLLGADEASREEFFTTTADFYKPWIRSNIDMPAWLQAQEILADSAHPVRKLSLDMVTYGTPIRYGWNEAGFAKLLHFINHRPPPHGEEFHTPIPLKIWRALRAADGDYINQIGIAGTNFPPIPFAARTFMADRRLHKLLEQNIPNEFIITRLRHRTRVPNAGITLLVDYQGDKLLPFDHLAGHALYTRRQWLPFHCQQIAQHFYNQT